MDTVHGTGGVTNETLTFLLFVLKKKMMVAFVVVINGWRNKWRC